ncbi:NUDIX hydrolase [Kitasatospora sp. NPDC018058]|uniref:NUDIX hydrolase n=1 Tax=Kitasatospora sp. NPDC018058 TaxID=3364025 RepID=UPI0037BEDF60
MIDFDVLTDLAFSEGIERIGVGVVVRDPSGRVLMIRRAPHDVLPGRWEYPGGYDKGLHMSQRLQEGML